jgi:hypothetical protein
VAARLRYRQPNITKLRRKHKVEQEATLDAIIETT